MYANPETAMIVQLGNPNIWREPESLSPGVRLVLAAGDFSQLAADPTWEEIEELALLIDGYAFTDRLPEVAACHDLVFWFNPIWEAHLEKNGPLPTSSLHLWLMLFVCQRGYLRDIWTSENLDGSPSIYATGIRNVYHSFRRAIAEESRAPDSNTTVYIPATSRPISNS